MFVTHFMFEPLIFFNQLTDFQVLREPRGQVGQLTPHLFHTNQLTYVGQ